MSDMIPAQQFRADRRKLRVGQQAVSDQLRVMGVKRPPTFREIAACETQGAAVPRLWLEAAYDVARGRLEEVTSG